MTDPRALRNQIDELKQRIESIGGDPDADSQPLPEAAGGGGRPQSKKNNIKQRRLLRGHFGKIYAMQWAVDSKKLVSASQDGKLIIWNGMSTNKVQAVTLRSSWVMSCAYSPDMKMVASGGLDNLCSVYLLGDGAPNDTRQQVIELAQHEGYLSCIRFLSDQELITSSGDQSCILWDLETKTPKILFQGHAADVMSVSIHENKFVSGSCDCTSKLWDIRLGKSVQTFEGHQSDINSVDFFVNGWAFGTGSDDSSCRLFDIRACAQINRFNSDKIVGGVTSVAFSKGGATLFAGYDDFNCLAWDTLGDLQNPYEPINGHDDRVSCVGVPENGLALCTGSWDTTLKVWAWG